MRFTHPLKRCCGGILTVAVLVLLAAAGRAQTTAAISGTVLDATGAVVPGARVLATNEATKAEWSASSNGVGFFSFAAVPPATYTLSVSHQGFETWRVTGIIVHPGDSLSVPKIDLQVGRTEVSITVTAETAGVTMDSPEHSTLITSGDINRLSTTGRDVDELVTVLPGFTVNAGTDIQNEGPGGLYGYDTMGFGSSQMASLGSNGAAPQQGLVNVTSDGANVIDPGDMGGQVSNVNMDQVQEVKVQTADFGADQSKGPIVINAVGKSGSSQYHGGLYTYFRNSALNSNDWLSKYYDSARPELRYFYPGGTLGGPVIFPHSSFNSKKSLVFWAGFEYYGQDASQGLATAFVPNPGMLGGDLSSATIAKALNVSLSDPTTGLLANCPADYSVSATYTNVGGICWSPNGSLDQTGAKVTNGQVVNIDPATTTISSLWPAVNRVPQPVVAGGTLIDQTDGINYAKNVMQSHNGFQLHTRIDQSITDSLKLFGIYNWERINDESAMNNIYYNPNGTVPYPTPMYSYGHAHYLTLNLTKTAGSSMTNELTVSAVYFAEPEQFGDRAKAQTTGTPWEAAGYSQGHLGLNESQLPQLITYETVGIPSFSFGYVPAGSQFLKKFSWNVGDNLTKVYKTHTIKAGYYMEHTGNNQVTLGSQVNGLIPFMRWDSCYPNQTTATPGAPGSDTNLGNTIGNFLIGCPLSYSQANSDPNANMRFWSFEGYVTDEWKVNPQLTLTLGIRFSHMEPWTDSHGVGMAVWNPSGVTQHALYSDTTSNTTWPGLYWHSRDSQYLPAGVPTRPLFYSPRGGFAYDLYSDGKTVFRGGWGIYMSHDPTNIASGALTTAIGMQTYNNPSTISCTYGQLFTTKYVPCGYYSSTPNTLTPFSVYAMDSKDNHMPVTYNYNFTVDQQGPWKSAFEIAYVGNRGLHLSTLGNLQNQNVIPLGAFFAPDPVTGSLNPPSSIPNSADYRPFPNYQDVYVANHNVWSNYNSMQTSWNRQAGSFVYGANYTWAKALGVRGNYDTGYIGDPVNPHHDYGIVSFDRRQVFNLTYSYQEGAKFKGNHVLEQTLNGWELSGISSLQSGPDLAVLNGATNYGLNGGVNYSVGTAAIGVPINAAEWLGSSDYSLQPNVTCTPSAKLKVDQYVNGNCFALPALGTQGWWNLPDSHGPAYFRWDMSVYKDFQISERQKLQFRVSGFNFLNHPLTSFNNNSLGNLSLAAGNCTGCKYTSLSDALAAATITNGSTFGYTPFRNGVRVVELGMKYDF